MKKSNLALMLMGRPGSGKGTQAKLLSEKFGWHHFQTSKILQSRFSQTKLSVAMKKARADYLAGKLVATKLTAKIVSQAIEELAKNKQAIVFDGSPRTVYEVERITPLLRKLYGAGNVLAIEVKISPSATIWRNSRRKICSKCGQSIPYTAATKDLKKCPNCQGELQTREIDKPAIIKKRLKVYDKQTAPVLQYLAKNNMLRVIDGEKSIAQVFSQIIEVLENW